MRVGYFQFQPEFGKVSRNLLKVTSALRGVDADLVVLPELAFSGYYFRDREEAMGFAEDPNDSPIIESLKDLCRHERLHLVTGFTEREGGKCFNSAALIGPDGLVHVYRKAHLFNNEKKWFTPGNTPLCTQTINGARIGILVCFDWAFPEPFRVLALQGAEIICHPSNLVLAHCQDVMRTRCLENRFFAVTCNRFGTDARDHGELTFTGRSQIVAPGGTVIHQSAAKEEELFITDIDPAEAREKHITPLNDLLADRRPDLYRELVFDLKKK